MFVRKKQNKSGSTSVFILKQEKGKQVLVKSMGASSSVDEIAHLEELARLEIIEMSEQGTLDLGYLEDEKHIQYIKETVGHVRVVGTELVLNKLFDEIGFNEIPEELFRHLVISRIVSPGSKLKTIEYLSRHHQKHYSSSTVYRYLDKLNSSYKSSLQEISFKHTQALLGGEISIVFYDVTTLYFEASKEDELRRLGYSKDGKAHKPQIVLGLLVSKGGYPLAFDIHKGNQYEGNTLIPILNRFKSTYNLTRLIVVADSGLLSKSNIKQLIENDYEFILGARIKSESAQNKEQMLGLDWSKKKIHSLSTQNDLTLIVTYSEKRAKKDAFNRNKGIERLKDKIRSGKLTKQNINNRGYNKYLKIKGEASIELDLSKLDQDAKWDGLKGYVTNTTLSQDQVVESYRDLWQIEKAFRMSKTDLEVRPIYHQKSKRIETHLIISFCSYKLYKELERQLIEKNVGFSLEKTIDILKSIYAISTVLPQSKLKTEIIMANTNEQKHILEKFNLEF